jgi:hypothetical protein
MRKHISFRTAFHGDCSVQHREPICFKTLHYKSRNYHISPCKWYTCSLKNSSGYLVCSTVHHPLQHRFCLKMLPVTLANEVINPHCRFCWCYCWTCGTCWEVTSIYKVIMFAHIFLITSSIMISLVFSPVCEWSCLHPCVTGTHTYSKGWRISIWMSGSCSSLVLPTRWCNKAVQLQIQCTELVITQWYLSVHAVDSLVG